MSNFVFSQRLAKKGQKPDGAWSLLQDDSCIPTRDANFLVDWATAWLVDGGVKLFLEFQKGNWTLTETQHFYFSHFGFFNEDGEVCESVKRFVKHNISIQKKHSSWEIAKPFEVE